MTLMDDPWKTIIKENSGLDIVLLHQNGERFEVLAVWEGPSLYYSRVSVLKVAGVPRFAGGELPKKRFKAMLMLADDAEHLISPEPSRWMNLEVQARRRARQRGLTCIFRAYNSEPSNFGPAYTLYDVPQLDLDSVKQLFADDTAGKLEVL